MRVRRYSELTTMFLFGFFLTFGVLSVTSLYAGFPKTFPAAAVMALVGGVSAVLARVRRWRDQQSRS
jgi:hypothetical protein